MGNEEETKEETNGEDDTTEKPAEEKKDERPDKLKPEEAVIGKCDFCYSYKRLQYPCICDDVGYCSANCRKQDRRYHQNCPGKITRNAEEIFDLEKPYYKLRFKSNSSSMENIDCALCGT
jgi:hypothetical protein